MKWSCFGKQEEIRKLYVKINVKLAKVTDKNCEKVRNNIKLRFIDNCRFKVSSLDKPTSNLYDTTMVLCDKCKGDSMLVNVSSW